MTRATLALTRLREFIANEQTAGRSLPWDASDLYTRYFAAYPRLPRPQDPFDGYDYGYDQRVAAYRLWSVGPDPESQTADDIIYIYDSRLPADQLKKRAVTALK